MVWGGFGGWGWEGGVCDESMIFWIGEGWREWQESHTLALLRIPSSPLRSPHSKCSRSSMPE